MLKKNIILSLIGFFTVATVAFSTMQLQKNHKNKKKHREKPDPHVTIMGPVVMADGIGRQTAELAKMLAHDYKVRIVSNSIVLDDVPREVKKILNTEYKGLGKVVIVEESLWAPDGRAERIDRMFDTVAQDDQIRFAYSMIESSRVINEWAMMLNLYFDGVIVPDPFLVEAYRDSGVTIPIFYVPLAVDLKDFINRPLKKKKEKGPMVFANLSTAIERKNQALLIKAFAKALGNNPNAALVINSRYNDITTRNKIMDTLAECKCSNIFYSDIVLRKDAYLKLFENIDCYVSLSTGEGFSIQPREAMALGIPVIATNNTAQSAICKTGLVRSVKSEILQPAHYYNHRLPTGYQFNCTLEDATAAIKDVYLNYDYYLSKGVESRKWASTFSYSNENNIKSYQTIVNPKDVVLGNENTITNDCIITDSKELQEKYQRLILNQKKKSKTKKKK